MLFEEARHKKVSFTEQSCDKEKKENRDTQKKENKQTHLLLNKKIKR